MADIYLHPACASKPARAAKVERLTNRLAVIDGPRVRLVTVDEGLSRHRQAGRVGLLTLPWK